MSADPWRLRRAACAPLLPGAQAPDPALVLAGLDPAEQAALPRLLLDQDLAALWQPLLHARPALAAAQPALFEVCNHAATAAAARYLLQRHVTGLAETALAAAAIPHCRIKGAHLRELLYAEPFRRRADDVDLLVAPGDRDPAVAALRAAGFAYRPDPRNLTHEAKLVRDGVAVDLHWEAMRPARLRASMGAALIDSRRWFDGAAGGHFGPDDPLHLVLLLTHPVFTKYATTPQARVVRAVDLAWWLAHRPPNWPRVIVELERIGLTVAAWVTLTWLACVTGSAAPHAIRAALAPGAGRQRWLGAWVRRDLASRFSAAPLLTQVAFTLPAQDRAADAWRMLRGARNRVD